MSAEMNSPLPGPGAAEGPLPMTRFRPNVVVAGAPPWAEDGWRRLRIGPVMFRAVKGSDRCVFTTIDPDTAAKGKEPLATLARYRRWDGKTWFGVNLIPDAPPPGAVIRPGDPVEIVQQAESDGPLRQAVPCRTAPGRTAPGRPGRGSQVSSHAQAESCSRPGPHGEAGRFPPCPAPPGSAQPGWCGRQLGVAGAYHADHRQRDRARRGICLHGLMLASGPVG